MVRFYDTYLQGMLQQQRYGLWCHQHRCQQVMCAVVAMVVYRVDDPGTDAAPPHPSNSRNNQN